MSRLPCLVMRVPISFFFLSFFSSLFNSVPNRCISDHQQLPPMWPPKAPKTHNHIQWFYTNKTSLWRNGGKTLWNRISYLQWICNNDTDTETPVSNNAFPDENYTTAEVNTRLWLFTDYMCSTLQCHSPVFICSYRSAHSCYQSRRFVITPLKIELLESTSHTCSVPFETCC